jgi:predicted transcriptional regulator
MRDTYTYSRAYLGTYVAPNVKRELVELAHERRTSLSTEIRQAVERYLDAEVFPRPASTA